MAVVVKIGALIALLIGAAYPIGAIVQLARRLNRKDRPPLTPTQLGLHFTLIAVVPVAGILGGFAGLLPAVWASDVLRVVILGAASASLVGFLILAWLSRTEGTPEGSE
jgi:hypothetical protein